MCGYCVEDLALGMLCHGFSHLQAEHSNAKGMLFCAYLKDCPDIVSTLALTPVAVAEQTAALVVACRGLETLIVNGFASPAYQALLKVPAFMAAVTSATDGASRERYLAQDPRFDLAAARWVADPRTFTEPDYLSNRIGQWTLPDGASLLGQYSDLMLRGIGLTHPSPKDRSLKAGTPDSVEDICRDDYAAFADRFMAFWCATLWLGQQAEGVSYLRDLMIHDPIGVPSFDGLALWLQRRAALIAYDLLGITPFVDNLRSVRPELYQFIGIVRRMPDELKSRLLEVLNRTGARDHEGDSFSLRRWLETGDLQR